MDYQRRNGRDKYKKSNRKTYQSPPRRYSRDDRRGRYGEGRSRDRSRSPRYSDEASRLDMQIEILRKQRMILEEERKLLEEQQKLDDIKVRSLKNERHSFSKRSFNEEYSSYVDDESQDDQEILTERKFEPKILSYHKASGVLLGKMYGLVEKYSTNETRKLLTSLVRNALKQRLAMALEGQPFFQTHKIIQIYRTIHPVSEDEDFVREQAESMDVSGWPDDSIVEAHEGNDGNATDRTGNDENAIEGNSTEELFDATHTEPLPVKISGKKMKLVYHQSVGILIKKLNVHMDKHSPPEKRNKLVTLLRAALRKRLEAIAVGQNIHQSTKMIKFYRAEHPLTEDEDFVISVLKSIDQGSEDDLTATADSKGLKGDVIDKNDPANKISDVSVTTDKTKKTNENKTVKELQNIEESLKNTKDGDFLEEVEASTEEAKVISPEEEKKDAGDNGVQERSATDTTTESGTKQIASEETIASETTDKPKDFNENESQNIQESVENANDSSRSDDVKHSIVKEKDDNANKEKNAHTAVESQDTGITKTKTESDQDQSTNIKINDSENTDTKIPEEKNDIQTNVQGDLINNTIEKSYASNQPVLNSEAVVSQSDLMCADLAQIDANNANVDEIIRGIKRKNEETEEKGMKVAKNSNLVISDGVDETNLVKPGDNDVENN